MKISTKGRYGVRAMLELAEHYSEGIVALSSIAQRQGISEGYLEQLFAVLRKNGLIKGTRGPQGGYSLSRAPHEISVGDILRVLEGSLTLVDCVMDDSESCCERSEFCVTRSLWKRIQDEVNGIVDSITLAKLLEDCKEKKDNNGYMYHI